MASLWLWRASYSGPLKLEDLTFMVVVAAERPLGCVAGRTVWVCDGRTWTCIARRLVESAASEWPGLTALLFSLALSAFNAQLAGMFTNPREAVIILPLWMIGWRRLHAAVFFGNLEIVQVLGHFLLECQRVVGPRESLRGGCHWARDAHLFGWLILHQSTSFRRKWGSWGEGGKNSHITPRCLDLKAVNFLSLKDKWIFSIR